MTSPTDREPELQRNPETKGIRAHPTILGALTIVTLIGTFLVDVGIRDGVASWAPYSLAIVLALQWKGAGAIVLVTATALIFMVVGFVLEPSGDLHRAATNRAIGAATVTLLSLICLYIDWRRSKHRKTVAAALSRLNQLQLFLHSLKKTAIVLSDLRGRVTEWNHAAQKLTGYPLERVIGQRIYHVFHLAETATEKWARIYRKARREGVATHKIVCHREDGSQYAVHVIVKPLRNQFGLLLGYSITLQTSTSRQVRT